MRDASGAYLDGEKTSVLDVPQPVPAKLFFGPEAAEGEEVDPDPPCGRLVRVLRIHGPESAAFDGSWRLPGFDRRS